MLSLQRLDNSDKWTYLLQESFNIIDTKKMSEVLI